MTESSDRAWADYSEHFRREVFPKLVSSAVTLSIIGRGGDIDVKQATELGAMLLLDKPIILVSVPGATIPSRLRRAADVVIEDWSPDNQSAQDQLAAAVQSLAVEMDGGRAVIVLEILRGIAETIRETLPSDEKEAGAWLSGLAYAFVLHWGALLLVTWSWCAQRGGC